jgi:sugar phosphate isomerase/epimerase
MKRRNALQLISAGLDVSSLSNQATAQPPQWKTAIGLNGFESGKHKYGNQYPIWDVADFAARKGFDGVELVSDWSGIGYPKPDDTKRINALKRFYDQYGLQVFSIQTSSGGAFDPDADIRKQWVTSYREWATFAKAVGADCTGTWPGGGLRGQTTSEAITHLAQSYHAMADIAGELGLTPAFEIEPPFVFNTEEHLVRILEEANHPGLKTIYDPSHFDLMNGSTGNPHEMLKRVGVENIGYIHLTDTDGTLRDGGTSKHLPCGDGHAQIDVSLKVLREGGFAGWIMIDEWEIPDVYDACNKGLKMIRAAMK